jgi:hypothetical protein
VRSTLRHAVAIALFIWAPGVAGANPSDQSDPARVANAAGEYLVFSDALTADCMLHRGRSRRIANTHPTRAIQVVLIAYTGKTRAQGDSEFILDPKTEPKPLGCDSVSGLARRWEIVHARFVSPARR